MDGVLMPLSNHQRIQSGQKLSDGGDLEEPVEARLLGRVIHIIDCERVWGGRKASREPWSREIRQSVRTMQTKTSHQYLVGVLGLNTWSRFCRTPAGLRTSETTVRKPALFLCWADRNESSLRTESVEDIGDENKLAGVELDHRGVGQKLRALEHRSMFFFFLHRRQQCFPRYFELSWVFLTAGLPGWRSSGLWPSGQRPRPPSGTGSAPRCGWRNPAGRGSAALSGNPAQPQTNK